MDPRQQMGRPVAFISAAFLALLLVLMATTVDAERSPSRRLLLSSHSSGGADLVDVTLYSEALCPYCAEFITGPLQQLFSTGLSAIVNLRIVPYGNAVEYKNGTVVCQHGPEECYLNKVEACTIHFYPKTAQWFGLVSCVEARAVGGRTGSHSWAQCGVAMGLDVNRIETCAQGTLGKKLDHANAEETGALDPPHQYVPWVLVDGKQLEDLDDLYHVICSSFKGKDKPEICSNLSKHELHAAAAYGAKTFKGFDDM